MSRSEIEATSILVLLKNQSYPNTKKFSKTHSLLPTVFVPENIATGMIFLKVTASDEDIGDNGKITYGIVSETYIPHAGRPLTKPYLKNHFDIHPSTGEISVAAYLPAQTEFRLNITATDAGGLSTFIVAPIFVNDVNDNAPVFEKSSYEFRIPEGVYDDLVVGQVTATDADFGENGNISYSILQKREDFSQMPLSITKDGSILIQGELDRELKGVYSFRVLAQDNGPLNNRLRATVDVDIKVLDINDNAPTFYNYDLTLTMKKSELIDKQPTEPDESVTVPVYYTSVVENSNIGGPIGKVFANDSDLTTNGNGVFLFSIKKRKSQKDLFVIDSKEGIVTALGPLDYEDQPMHNITIVAYDLGGPSMSSTALMIVNVVDVPELTPEENPSPMFAHRYYELEVEENCAVPLELLALNVSDEHRDKLYNMKFSIAPNEHNEYFTVDHYNGSLYLVTSPDREQIEELTVTVRVDKISRRGKTLQMIYPLGPESLNNLGKRESDVNSYLIILFYFEFHVILDHHFRKTCSCQIYVKKVISKFNVTIVGFN
uniref:Cadherin-89D n=1 Tax=Cacopsylla melanoneura TaxID=428564 RepID=A0A8D8TPP1_9HEMI